MNHAFLSSLDQFGPRHADFVAEIRRFAASDASLNSTTQPIAPEPQQGAAKLFSSGECDFLINCSEAHAAAGCLARLEPGRTLAHLFHSPGQLATFLGDPACRTCLADERWTPWLMKADGLTDHGRRWLHQTNRRNWPWPLILKGVDLGPAVPLALKLGAELLNELAAAVHRAIEQLQTLYKDHPTPAQVLAAAARPLRILIIAPSNSAYQRYCARDLLDGLAEAGVEAQSLLLEPLPTTQIELLERLVAFQPDILLCNGTGRADYTGMPPGLSIVSWDQDFLLSESAKYVAAMSPRDRLRVMVREWMVDAAARGVDARRLAHLNLGANVKVYHPPAAPRKPDFDVLFVGNFYPFEQYRRMIGFDKLDEPTRRAMELARNRLADWVDAQGEQEAAVIPDLEPLLMGSYADLGYRPNIKPLHQRWLVWYFRYRIAHFVLREKYISALAGFNLGLFGRGWENVKPVAHLARPEIANGPPLLDAIHRSAINLHLHTWTVHHPRLYDTAAAAGFLLVGRVPELDPLESVFDIGPGRELDCFGSIADLKTRISHYLDHPELRTEMGLAAARRVLRDHTMARRMQDLIGSFTDDGPEPEHQRQNSGQPLPAAV